MALHKALRSSVVIADFLGRVRWGTGVGLLPSLGEIVADFGLPNNVATNGLRSASSKQGRPEPHFQSEGRTWREIRMFRSDNNRAGQQPCWTTAVLDQDGADGGPSRHRAACLRGCGRGGWLRVRAHLVINYCRAGRPRLCFRDGKTVTHLAPVGEAPPATPLAVICVAAAIQFGREVDSWAVGTRSDDASRAVAAYLAHRRLGYAACEVAGALGYRSHGSVCNALARVESDTSQCSHSGNALWESC